MPGGVSVDDRAARQLIEQIERRAADLTPAYPAIGGALVADAQMTFRAARDPWGVPWAPLSQTTLMRRAARRTGGQPFRRDGRLKKAAAGIIASAKPMLDTGVLRNSITFRIEGATLVVGTNLAKAGPLQFGARKGAYGRTARGGPIPWGDIPARPFLPLRRPGARPDLPAEVARQVVDLLRQHIFGRP